MLAVWDWVVANERCEWYSVQRHHEYMAVECAVRSWCDRLICRDAEVKGNRFGRENVADTLGSGSGGLS